MIGVGDAFGDGDARGGIHEMERICGFSLEYHMSSGTRMHVNVFQLILIITHKLRRLRPATGQKPIGNQQPCLPRGTVKASVHNLVKKECKCMRGDQGYELFVFELKYPE